MPFSTCELNVEISLRMCHPLRMVEKSGLQGKLNNRLKLNFSASGGAGLINQAQGKTYPVKNRTRKGNTVELVQYPSVARHKMT